MLLQEMKENITQGMYGMITVKVTDISFEDIISYIALTHEIKLTEAAMNAFLNWKYQ